jgi:putative transposase
VIDGVLELVAKSSNELGHLLRRLDNLNLCEAFTHEQFEELRRDGRLNIIRDYHSASAAALRLEGPEQLISELNPKRRERLLARKDIVDAFLREEDADKATRSDASMRAFIKAYVLKLLEQALNEGRCGQDDIFVKRPPSPTALRKWVRKYEACGFDTMALRDGYGRSGNRLPKLESEERLLMQEIAQRYASRLKPTKASLYIELTDAIRMKNLERRKIGERVLKKPSRAAFERVIANLDPFMVYAGREGEAAARKKFFIVRGGLDVSRPLERVEMDDWLIPLQVILEDAGVWALLPPELKAAVNRKRLWLAVAIDAYTRCVLAARIIDESSSTAAVATIEMAVNDKSRYAVAAGCQTPWDYYGSMETLSTDNASVYTAYETRAAVTDLGAEILFPPAGTPQNRARIERLFRTIHDQLVALFHGRSFENIIAKGDYNSEAHAIFDRDELGRVIVRWLVDVYHNTPHEGLGGETPRNRWIRTTRLHPVLPPPDADVSRHIFGITVERRITNSGVRVLGLHYQSEELQRLRRDARQKPVLVRIDEGDLGYVSVRTKEGWLTVRCVRSGFDGVSLERWVATERALRREHANMARLSEEIVFQALSEIKAIADAATERAGIACPIITSADVDRLERNVFRTFDFDRGVEDGPAVLEFINAVTEDEAGTLPATDNNAAQTDSDESAALEEPSVTDGMGEDNYGMED